MLNRIRVRVRVRKNKSDMPSIGYGCIVLDILVGTKTPKIKSYTKKGLFSVCVLT